MAGDLDLTGVDGIIFSDGIPNPSVADVIWTVGGDRDSVAGGVDGSTEKAERSPSPGVLSMNPWGSSSLSNTISTLEPPLQGSSPPRERIKSEKPSKTFILWSILIKQTAF